MSFTPPPANASHRPAPASGTGSPHVRVCPECAGPIVRSCACVTCAHCGWGRCL